MTQPITPDFRRARNDKGTNSVLLLSLFLVALSVLFDLGGCTGSRPVVTAPPCTGIEEPSGVARQGNRLLIVGDEEPGHVLELLDALCRGPLEFPLGQWTSVK